MSDDAIVVRGRLYARVVERTPRVVSVVGEGIGIVYENETTPWSWTSKPGVERYFTVSGPVFFRTPDGRVWLETMRIDGGRFGFQCYVAERFKQRVDESAIETKRGPR